MDSVLHNRIDELIETFRHQLHQQADQVTLGQDGAVLLELERTLFGLLMALGAALVMAFVEAFHRQAAWVIGLPGKGRWKRSAQRGMALHPVVCAVWRPTYDSHALCPFGSDRQAWPTTGMGKTRQGGHRQLSGVGGLGLSSQRHPSPVVGSGQPVGMGSIRRSCLDSAF